MFYQYEINGCILPFPLLSYCSLVSLNFLGPGSRQEQFFYLILSLNFLIHVDTTTIFWLNLSSSINLDRFSVGGGSEKPRSFSRGWRKDLFLMGKEKNVLIPIVHRFMDNLMKKHQAFSHQHLDIVSRC